MVWLTALPYHCPHMLLPKIKKVKHRLQLLYKHKHKHWCSLGSYELLASFLLGPFQSGKCNLYSQESRDVCHCPKAVWDRVFHSQRSS